jgi:protein TonB
VRPVDSLEGALEAMARGKRGQLLVIDARDVADVRDAVDAAHAAAPGAVVLVFAAGAAEQQLGTSLAGSNVFAVLPMPLDPRKTQAVVEGALAEAVARCAPAAPAANPLSSLRSELSVDTFEPQPAAVSERSGRGSKPPLLVFVAAGVTVLALGGGATWYFSSGGNTTAPAPAPLANTPPGAPARAEEQAAATAETPVAAPGAETLIVRGKVDELLEKARLAMRERRFAEPAGDNALLYYRSAVAADATSAEGRDGLQRVAAVLASRFDEAMGGGRLEEAAQALANFKSAAPGDTRFVAFEQRLYAAEVSKALNDGNLERAAQFVRQAQQSTAIPAAEVARWRADIARRQDEAKVQRLAGLVEERIEEGRLTDSDDGARTHLLLLQAAAPASAMTQRVTRELIAADLRKARDAALARNSVEQERWLAEARAVGMKPAEAAAFQREIASSRQKAFQADNDRLAQLARDRLRDGRLTEPGQDSAAWYLTQLQAADAGSAALADASRDLAGKLLERAHSAVLAGRPADADLAQARRWGADPKDIAAVEQLQALRSRGAASDPAALVANLKRVRAAAPEYPQAAIAQQIAGSVTLEYTVDIRGEPHDIHVVEATPPGVFDQAATTAVKRWRYAPTVVNGTAVDVPGVRTRIRFELPK